MLFGEAVDQQGFSEPTAAELIGMGWLYALHARSSIVRGRLWQAQYMLNGLRDHVLMLACLRHNLPTSQGRGYHLLPSATIGAMEATLARSFDGRELTRAFAAAVDVFLTEIDQVDTDLAHRLRAPLAELAKQPDLD